MDKTIKAKWLKALRSGEYLQGMGYLYSLDVETREARYCCLGVLCSTLGLDTEAARDYGHREDMLNAKTLHALGLKNTDQEFLAAMNDGGDYEGERVGQHTFVEIADWIETNL